MLSQDLLKAAQNIVDKELAIVDIEEALNNQDNLREWIMLQSKAIHASQHHPREQASITKTYHQVEDYAAEFQSSEFESTRYANHKTRKNYIDHVNHQRQFLPQEQGRYDEYNVDYKGYLYSKSPIHSNAHQYKYKHPYDENYDPDYYYFDDHDNINEEFVSLPHRQFYTKTSTDNQYPSPSKQYNLKSKRETIATTTTTTATPAKQYSNSMEPISSNVRKINRLPLASLSGQSSKLSGTKTPAKLTTISSHFSSSRNVNHSTAWHNFTTPTHRHVRKTITSVHDDSDDDTTRDSSAKKRSSTKNRQDFVVPSALTALTTTKSGLTFQNMRKYNEEKEKELQEHDKRLLTTYRNELQKVKKKQLVNHKNNKHHHPHQFYKSSSSTPCSYKQSPITNNKTTFSENLKVLSKQSSSQPLRKYTAEELEMYLENEEKKEEKILDTRKKWIADNILKLKVRLEDNLAFNNELKNHSLLHHTAQEQQEEEEHYNEDHNKDDNHDDLEQVEQTIRIEVLKLNPTSDENGQSVSVSDEEMQHNQKEDDTQSVNGNENENRQVVNQLSKDSDRIESMENEIYAENDQTAMIENHASVLMTNEKKKSGSIEDELLKENREKLQAIFGTIHAVIENASSLMESSFEKVEDGPGDDLFQTEKEPLVLSEAGLLLDEHHLEKNEESLKDMVLDIQNENIPIASGLPLNGDEEQGNVIEAQDTRSDKIQNNVDYFDLPDPKFLASLMILNDQTNIFDANVSKIVHDYDVTSFSKWADTDISILSSSSMGHEENQQNSPPIKNHDGYQIGKGHEAEVTPAIQKKDVLSEDVHRRILKSRIAQQKYLVDLYQLDCHEKDPRVSKQETQILDLIPSETLLLFSQEMKSFTQEILDSCVESVAEEVIEYFDLFVDKMIQTELGMN